MRPAETMRSGGLRKRPSNRLGSRFWRLVSCTARRRQGDSGDTVYPLAEIAAAHERLEAGEQLGKIVLSIPA